MPERESLSDRSTCAADEVDRLRELLALRAQDGMGPVQRGAWDDLKAERDKYRDALLNIGERVMTFGGFQRTERGEFWISRDAVCRLIDEVCGTALGTDEIQDGGDS